MRTTRASDPRRVTSVNTRSVVSTSRRAKAIRSGSYVSSRLSGTAFFSDGGELPCEIHGIPDARVHALTADRAMDVRGIPEQKCASATEMVRDSMVDAIGREPVHLLYGELEVFDRFASNVVERQRAVVVAWDVADVPHEAQPPISLEREDEHEVGLLEIDVQLLIGHRSRRLHVGDVEPACIRSPRETDGQLLPHGGCRTVAPRDVGCLANFFGAVRQPKRCPHTVALFREAEQLRAPLHLDAGGAQSFDQQTLMSVLRKDQREAVGTEPLANALERYARGARAVHPEVEIGNLHSAGNDRVRQSDLVIELQRTRLDGEGTRCRARFGSLVDDPYGDAESRQPQREDESGRTSSDNQDERVIHRFTFTVQGYSFPELPLATG